MTHFVLHNSQAANGNGMEIYEASEAKKMLDRMLEIFDGEGLHHASKNLAGLLIDGKIDAVFQKVNGAIREATFYSLSRLKRIHVYIATIGKAP